MGDDDTSFGGVRFSSTGLESLDSLDSEGLSSHFSGLIDLKYLSKIEVLSPLFGLAFSLCATGDPSNCGVGGSSSQASNSSSSSSLLALYLKENDVDAADVLAEIEQIFEYTLVASLLILQ